MHSHPHYPNQYGISNDVCLSFLKLVICILFLLFSAPYPLPERSLSSLLLFSKNHHWVSLVFPYWLPVFNYIDYCSNSSFFPSAYFRFNFALLFLVSSGGDLWLLILGLSPILIWTFNTTNFLLSTAFAASHSLYF